MDAIGLGIGYAVGPRAGAARGGAAPFDPAALFASGEEGAWYDPSQPGSMFQDSGGTIAAAVGAPVGRIEDRSGRGHHAVQAAAAARPILRQDASDNLYLEFDGVDDSLRATFSLPQPWDRIAAIRQLSFGNAGRVFGGASGFDSELFQYATAPQLAIFYGGAIAGLNSDAPMAENVITTERANGASSSVTINDGTPAPGDAGSAASTGIIIGGRSDDSFYGNIRFYGGLMRAGTLTAGELAQVRSHVAAKASVTL